LGIPPSFHKVVQLVVARVLPAKKASKPESHEQVDDQVNDVVHFLVQVEVDEHDVHSQLQILGADRLHGDPLESLHVELGEARVHDGRVALAVEEDDHDQRGELEQLLEGEEEADDAGQQHGHEVVLLDFLGVHQEDLLLAEVLGVFVLGVLTLLHLRGLQKHFEVGGVDEDEELVFDDGQLLEHVGEQHEELDRKLGVGELHDTLTLLLVHEDRDRLLYRLHDLESDQHDVHSHVYQHLAQRVEVIQVPLHLSLVRPQKRKLVLPSPLPVSRLVGP